MRRALAALLFLACIAPRAHALTADEHRALALQAFEPTLRGLGVTVGTKTLAEITVLTSRDDLSPSRFQVRGLSPFQQAAVVSPERLEAIVADVIEHPPTDNAFFPYADNAVANYVVYHTLALRCIEKGRPDWDTDPPPRTFHYRDEWVERALVFEAVALGYLGDCYSSSHMLTPRHLWLTRLQGTNVRAAHDFFATQGAYVFAAREVWQTFGDGVLQWNGPAWERAAAACRRSVEQVAWLLNPNLSSPRRDQGALPETMDAIPIPVVAAWRFHKALELQFREPGLHDPDLAVDERFLYSRDAFPRGYSNAALFFGLHDTSALSAPDAVAQQVEDMLEVLKTDPNDESVEYHQTLDVPPAWAGLLVMAGGGVLVKDDGGGAVGSVAAGYGWEFRVPLLSLLRTSLETEYVYRLGAVDRRVIAPRYTLGIGSPLLPVVEAIHFEVGYAWGLEAPHKDQGVKWAVGIGTRPLRLAFTYAGVSLSAKYERFWLDETLDGFQLQLVFR